MQRAPAAIDIDGRQVHIGSPVQLKWLGVWYEGFVVEIGPKRNLCKVRDAKSKETVLLESSHLQLRDGGVTDKRLATGARVVYTDGECGREGVVETTSAVGAILVSWRKSGLSKEKLTWFELSHIAPVVHNKLYVEHNQDMLKARKSGLLHNDAIEPRPRTMDNLLYESGSDEETEILTKLAASKRYMAQRNRGKDSSHSFDGEGVADKEKKLANSEPFPLQPDPLPSYPLPLAPVFMPLPPMMSHLPIMSLPPMMPHPPIMPLPQMTPHSNSYMSLPLDAHMKSLSSFTGAPGDPHRSSSPHPLSLTRLGQAQSSRRHCITTYTTYTSGIPPHPSSKFLQGLQDDNLGNRISGHRTKARGRKYSSAMSQARSEPTHYTTVSKPTTKKPEVPNLSKEKSVPPTHMSQPTSHYSTTSTRSQGSKDKSRLGKKEDVFQGVTSPLRPRALPPQLKADTDDSRLKQPQSTRGSEISSERGMRSGSSGSMGERRPEMEEEATDDEDEYSSVFTDNDKTQVNDNKNDAAGLKVVSASPAYETVSHGGSTLLTCVAQSQRCVHYQWLREGKPISEHDPFFTQPAPGMLQIQMASLYLTGEYRCVVSDSHSSLERVFHLEVCSETLVSEAEVETHVGNIPPDYEAAIADTNRAKANSPQPAPNSKPPITGVKIPQSESSPHPTKSPSYTSPAVASLPQPSSGRDMPDTTGKEDDGAGNKKMRTEQENMVSKGKCGGRRAHRNRCRASAALKNDMEIYLKGYGDNYGGVSSQSTQLEISTEGGEGERRWRKKRPKEKKNKKKAKSLSQGSSSPVKSTSSLENKESLKHPRKKSFGKLPTSLLGKSKKKQGVAGMEKTPPLTPAWTEETLPTPTVASDSAGKVAHDKEETATSAAVQASVGGSTGSEERKKGFLSNIFPRSRSS